MRNEVNIQCRSLLLVIQFREKVYNIYRKFMYTKYYETKSSSVTYIVTDEKKNLYNRDCRRERSST